jgi:hypothetical protein
VPATEHLQEGDLYFGGPSNGTMIYHSTWKPVPNDTWVEVAHSAVPTELVGSWQWRLQGSGIWYNVGRTLVFPTPKSVVLTHRAAITFLEKNCSKKISPNWPVGVTA